MSTKKITSHLLSGRSTSGDLAKQSASAKRTATGIRQLMQATGASLSKADQETLKSAARILDDISAATTTAKLRRFVAEGAEKERREAAFNAVERAFADVVDPAGVVAMLAAGGSWRMHLLEERARLDNYDAREIMTRERREALDSYAYRIADTKDCDVETEATAVRERFNQLRGELEIKHASLIVQLQQALDIAKG